MQIKNVTNKIVLLLTNILVMIHFTIPNRENVVNVAPFALCCCSSLSSFKKFLRATYFTLLDTTYNNIDMPCTWFLSRNCPCHRSYKILDFFSVFDNLDLSPCCASHGIFLPFAQSLLVFYSFLLIYYLYMFTYCL